MKIFLLLFLTLYSLYAQPPSYKQEIQHLLNYVQKTDCSYIRNGESHNGDEARKHIQMKYNYFKDDIHSAEDFIRLSATKSTMWGNKYYIVCPHQNKIPSSQWLLQELHRYRETKK
jgi:hypothetical protein